jgi:hypothetical protein
MNLLLEKPKVAGAQIQPEKLPSLLASLIEVFKEKPFFPFSASISILALLIFIFRKIKKFISQKS